MARVTEKPAAINAASAVERVMHGDQGWRPEWLKIVDRPEDAMLIIDGGLLRWDGHNDVGWGPVKSWVGYMDTLLCRWSVYELTHSDVLDEHEVLQELWRRRRRSRGTAARRAAWRHLQSRPASTNRCSRRSRTRHQTRR